MVVPGIVAMLVSLIVREKLVRRTEEQTVGDLVNMTRPQIVAERERLLQKLGPEHYQKARYAGQFLDTMNEAAGCPQCLSPVHATGEIRQMVEILPPTVSPTGNAAPHRGTDPSLGNCAYFPGAAHCPATGGRRRRDRRGGGKACPTGRARDPLKNRSAEYDPKRQPSSHAVAQRRGNNRKRDKWKLLRNSPRSTRLSIAGRYLRGNVPTALTPP